MATPAEEEGHAQKSKVAGEQLQTEPQATESTGGVGLECAHNLSREKRLTRMPANGRSEMHEGDRDVMQEAEDDEYEYVLCTDAGRQFANRPYYKRVRKQAPEAESAQSNMRINMHKMADAQVSSSWYTGWYPGQELPSEPTLVVLCGGAERTGDIRSYVENMTDPSMHCVVIDPQELGGYAQDLRQPTVFKALAV